MLAVVVKVPTDVPLDILGPLGCGIQTGAGASSTASTRPPARASRSSARERWATPRSWLYRAGHFPFDRLIEHYPFAEIEKAFADPEHGVTVKPVLTF